MDHRHGAFPLTGLNQITGTFPDRKAFGVGYLLSKKWHSLRPPASQFQGSGPVDPESLACRLHPKIAKDINRFDFSMDPHRIGYQCQLVISGPDCAGQIEYGKGLIQPPLSRNGRQGLPVQAHFPYMGTFHHGLETIQIDAVTYLKMIRCCKAGPCLEGITVQDICFELHGCIPRIPVCKAMEFEYRICRMVYMQIPEQTCSQLDVAEVNRQDIRTEPLHLGGSGSDFPEIGRLWHMIRETRPLLPADKK